MKGSSFNSMSVYYVYGITSEYWVSLHIISCLKNSEAQREIFVCVSVGDFFLRVLETPSFLLVVFTRVVTVMIFIFKIKKILPKILEIQWVFLGSHPNR